METQTTVKRERARARENNQSASEHREQRERESERGKCAKRERQTKRVGHKPGRLAAHSAHSRKPKANTSALLATWQVQSTGILLKRQHV